MDFIKTRRIWYTISLTIAFIGLIAFMWHGLNLSVDFTGGTIIEFKFDKNSTVTIPEIEKILTELNLNDVSSVVETSTADFKGILIRTKHLQHDEVVQIQEALKANHAEVEVLRTEQVGPAIGKELRWKALLALLIASISIVAYISFRFQFKFAMASIIALLHDVVIVVSFFAIFQWEVDTTFVAAILTIVGYSINDTIVIFDRIRENLKLQRKMPFDELCNKSIIETLPRSLKTGTTTLLTIIALMIFGGASIKIFMLALFLGIVVGTYSSICIASPLMVTWDNWGKSTEKLKG